MVCAEVHLLPEGGARAVKAACGHGPHGAGRAGSGRGWLDRNGPGSVPCRLDRPPPCW
jgi:hypothetical protein